MDGLEQHFIRDSVSLIMGRIRVENKSWLDEGGRKRWVYESRLEARNVGAVRAGRLAVPVGFEWRDAGFPSSRKGKVLFPGTVAQGKDGFLLAAGP
jgi:hypothetical protein